MYRRLMEWLCGPEQISWDEITDRTTSGELSRQEALCIDNGECPDCGGKIKVGPEGVGSTNVGCSRCGHAFNMALGFGCGDRIEDPVLQWRD